MKKICLKCDRMAVWDYAPKDGDLSYCDECVPRGCSCNLLCPDDGHDGEQEHDDQDRELPCVEYDFNPKGFDEESFIDSKGRKL